MISRTLASVLPRQSPNSLILSSINFEADSAGTGFFICSSNSGTYLPQPPGCWSGTRGPDLDAAPEEVREPTEHAGRGRPAPDLRTIAHREVCVERGCEGDGEAGVGPLLEARRHRQEKQDNAEELGPRELHAEVGREAEVGEHLRHLREAQLRVGGEAYLQTEESSDDPIADGRGFGAGPGGDEGRYLQGRFH